MTGIKRPRSWKAPGLVLAVGVFCLVAGCADEQGPVRYELSGAITYAGKPVPAGTMLLEPDSEAGNKGPRGVAAIEGGRFKTFPDKGTVGGPHVVTIMSGDGVPIGDNPFGKPVFSPYSTNVDLPKSDATVDFDVPRQPGS
jgi:hypothetical protein